MLLHRVRSDLVIGMLVVIKYSLLCGLSYCLGLEILSLHNFFSVFFFFLKLSKTMYAIVMLELGWVEDGKDYWMDFTGFSLCLLADFNFSYLACSRVGESIR